MKTFHNQPLLVFKCYRNKHIADPKKIILDLPRLPEGRPLLIGPQLDDLVLKQCQQLRLKGAPLNAVIVQAIARGIVQHHNPSLLIGSGGSEYIGDTWAQSFFRRHNFVKRKGTKASRTLPSDFATIKTAFHHRIKTIVDELLVLKVLIYNFDQTGVKIVPVDAWTHEIKGSTQVEIIALNDKRQITALLTTCLDGSLLPPQLIYAGKTTQCHPKFHFPKDWLISHSDSHWSTDISMEEWLSELFLPHLQAKRKELKLRNNQPAILIFDLFKCHQNESFLNTLKENNVQAIFVPASCTDQLQPNDCSLNKPFKVELKRYFTSWYADQVKTFLELQNENKDPAKKGEFTVDLSLTRLKPLHSKWMVDTFQTLTRNTEQVVEQGWKSAGIDVLVPLPRRRGRINV